MQVYIFCVFLGLQFRERSEGKILDPIFQLLPTLDFLIKFKL